MTTKPSQPKASDKDLFNWLESQHATLECRPGDILRAYEWVCIIVHNSQKRYLYGNSPRSAIGAAMTYVRENS